MRVVYNKYLLVEQCLTEKDDYHANRNVKPNRKRIYGRAAGIGAVAGGAVGAVASSRRVVSLPR
jgi:hypothetical protein